MKTHVGSKFYRFTGESDFQKLEMLRLVRIKNQNTYVLVDENNTKIKMDLETLKKEYTKLSPDGFLSLSIVKLDNNMNDVIITLHRRQEIENADDTPYIVCRQSIYDFFTNQVNHSDDIRYIGMSISQESCPPQLKVRDCSICNSVIKSQVIDVYLDDTFNSILSLLNTQEADRVLDKLARTAPPNIYGWCSSVKDLMIGTRFMYDFLRAFNIYPLNFKIIIQDGNTLSHDQVVQFEDMIKRQILKILVVPYAKDIDFDSIKNNYMIVSDIDEKLYVLMFEAGGYINRPYEQLEDHRDRDAMINVVKNRLVK